MSKHTPGPWMVEVKHYTPGGKLSVNGPDEREHELSPGCWCEPRQDEDEPNVWIHNVSRLK